MKCSKHFLASKIALLCMGLFAQTYVGADQIDSLRHLQESWPRLDSLKPDSQPKSSKSSRRLRGLYRNYLNALEAVQASLGQADTSDCQRGHLLAVQDLLSIAKSEEGMLTLCEVSCRASELRLQKLQDLLDQLDEETKDCVRGAVTRAWLYSKKTHLKGLLGVEMEHFSNAGAQAADSATEAQNDLRLGARLDFDYRAQNFWTALDAEGALLLRKDSNNKWPFSIRNQWIYQESRHAFMVEGSWTKQFPYSHTTAISTNTYTSNTYDSSVVWKLPLGARSLSVEGSWTKESWDEGIWSHNSWGPRLAYYLSERHLESTQIYLAPRRISMDKPSSLSLWSTGLGLLFEERRNETEVSLLRLGIQDRRSSGEGAGLWPDLEILASGPDLVLPRLYPSWILKLGPVETPWSLSTLRALSGMGLKYIWKDLILPLELRMARDFHRSSPGGQRDDLMLSASISPSVRLQKNFLIELPLVWNRFWILQSLNAPSSVLAAYPQNSYTAYEARLRVKYEF